MMKYIFTYLIISICTLAFAQNIPNGDFEDWQKRNHYSLNSWYSTLKNVERTTDAKEGQYAIKLTNTYSATSNGTRGLARNLDLNNKEKINGDAVSGDALSISFWCKYDLAVGDTARFYVILREEGVYKGKVDFRFTGSSSDEFVKFAVPIEWNTSGNRQIDSAWFYLYSYVETVVDGDGYVIFDDIAFENIGERVGSFRNSGFENWDTTAIEYPNAWRTIDLREYDNFTRYLPAQSAFKVEGDSAFIGNSLKIQSYNHNGETRTGYTYIGSEDKHATSRSFAINDTFQYLQGYYRYVDAPQDSVRILMRTYQGSSTMSSANYYLHETEDWTFFSLPINYGNSTGTPDSAMIRIWSGTATPEDDKYPALYLDNLKFTLEPTPLKLGVAELEQEVTFYPNPTSGFLHLKTQEQYVSATLTNVLGQSQDIYLSNNIVDLKEEPSGLYYLTLYTAEGKVSTIKVQKR